MQFQFNPVLALISFVGGLFVGSSVSFGLRSWLRNQPHVRPSYQKRRNLEPFVVVALVGGIIAMPVYTGLYYLTDRGTIWDGVFHGLGWFAGALLVGWLLWRKQHQS